jgi:hypothetical protein
MRSLLAATWLALMILMTLWARAEDLQITQLAPHNTTLVRAVGEKGHYIGFDVLADGKLVAPVRFTSAGMIFASAADANNQGNVSTLIFTKLHALPESGLELGESRVEIRLDSQRYPVVRFDLRIKAFNQQKWQATLGPQPFHFLTLSMPDATVWQHCGWLNATPKADPFPLLLDVHVGSPELSAYPYNRQWSTTPPLSAHPLPVIGLWAPDHHLYAAWDFQSARLTDNSERDIATGFCNHLELPLPLIPSPKGKGEEPTPSPLLPKSTPSATSPPAVSALRAKSQQESEPPNVEPGPFVALVYPYGGQGYQHLEYPIGGEHLASHATLVYSIDLDSTNDPNRFLWQTWWADDALRNRLPRVPVLNDLSWIPGGARMKTLSGAPQGKLIDGVEGSFQVPGSQLIGGWGWHNESAIAAPAKRGDKARIAALEQEAATLVKLAKHFKADKESCVYWEKPLTGRWTDEWGGLPVTTLHNANGWAAGRLLLDLYHYAGHNAYLPLVDGVFNWTKHIVWTRNEFADVPSSPFAIGGTLSTAFLLDYYFTLRDDPAHRTRALLALDMARSFTYRYMVMWTADSIRDDNLDSAFLWEPNSGRDWTGAACSNEVIFNLDTLAQTAVHTGDPILIWALQGTLSRWHQLYQDVYHHSLAEYQSGDFTEGYGLAPGNVYGYPGKRAPYGFGGPLTMLEPVGDSVVRVLAGEKAALAFDKDGVHTGLHDYRCTGPGDFAVTFQSLHAEITATITFPYADLSDKPVSILRDGVIKIPLVPGKQVLRDPNSLWSLIVRGLRGTDTLIVGNPDLTTAERLPMLPPMTLTNTLPEAAQTAPFQPVPLPYDTLLDTSWEDLDSYAGLSRGLRWMDGVPFALPPVGSLSALTRFPAQISIPDARVLYVLYEAHSGEEGNVALPVFLLDDNAITPPSSATQALAWRAWPPIYTQRLLVAAFAVPPGKQVRAILASAGQKVLAVTALLNGPEAEAKEVEVNAALLHGATEWRTVQRGDALAAEVRTLAARLPEGRVAILPPHPEGSPANALLARGDFLPRMTTLTPDQTIDPTQFSASRFPAALYLDGEDYVDTVKAPGDASDALSRYLREGGTLILLSGMPYPLYYATGPNGQHQAAPLLPRLGLPLYNAIETEPNEARTVQQVTGQMALPDLPNTFPVLPGDPRLRSVDRAHLPSGATYTPIYRVRGATGTDYGDAAALIELPAAPDGKRGRILYISNVLLRDPDNGPLIVRAVLRWLLNVASPKSSDVADANPSRGP